MVYNGVYKGYGYVHMDKITKVTFSIIAFALIGYVVSFLIPPPPGATETELSMFHWTLANSVLYTSLYVGAAILFLIGVTAYKAKLRIAYMAIAIGVVLVGAGLAQVVLLKIFNMLQSPWVLYGGVMLPFVAAGFAIYFGVRSRAKLISVASPLTKLKIIVPILLACIILGSFLPHTNSSLPEIFFDASNAISILDVILYAASFWLVLKIRNRSGAHYTSSLSWLMFGLASSAIISLSILLITLTTGETLTGNLIDALVIIGGLLYLKAGHSFAKTKEL